MSGEPHGESPPLCNPPKKEPSRTLDCILRSTSAQDPRCRLARPSQTSIFCRIAPHPLPHRHRPSTNPTLRTYIAMLASQRTVGQPGAGRSVRQPLVTCNANESSTSRVRFQSSRAASPLVPLSGHAPEAAQMLWKNGALSQARRPQNQVSSLSSRAGPPRNAPSYPPTHPLPPVAGAPATHTPLTLPPSALQIVEPVESAQPSTTSSADE